MEAFDHLAGALLEYAVGVQRSVEVLLQIQRRLLSGVLGDRDAAATIQSEQRAQRQQRFS